MVEIERRRMTAGTLSFPEEHLLTAGFTCSGFGPVQAVRNGIELRRRRKVEHVLELRHVAHANAIENHHSLFHRMNRIAIEIGSALLKFGKVFDGPQAAFRPVNLLVEHAAEASGVQAESPLLG